jgi:hypothetical protein
MYGVIPGPHKRGMRNEHTVGTHCVGARPVDRSLFDDGFWGVVADPRDSDAHPGVYCMYCRITMSADTVDFVDSDMRFNSSSTPTIACSAAAEGAANDKAATLSVIGSRFGVRMGHRRGNYPFYPDPRHLRPVGGEGVFYADTGCRYAVRIESVACPIRLLGIHINGMAVAVPPDHLERVIYPPRGDAISIPQMILSDCASNPQPYQSIALRVRVFPTTYQDDEREPNLHVFEDKTVSFFVKSTMEQIQSLAHTRGEATAPGLPG